jgi:hypothetical protein
MSKDEFDKWVKTVPTINARLDIVPATVAGFEIPLDMFDELDLWPLSLSECKAFFGSCSV